MSRVSCAKTVHLVKCCYGNKLKTRPWVINSTDRYRSITYIVDFYCHELAVCIEIDGNSHEIDTVFENDIKRQKRLEAVGVRFIRVNDKDVKRDIKNVVCAIAGKIAELH